VSSRWSRCGPFHHSDSKRRKRYECQLLFLGDTNVHPTIPPTQFFRSFHAPEEQKAEDPQKQQSDDKDLETLVKKWTMPPTKLPSDDYEVCALFVSNENGDPLTPEELASHGDASNLFFFPSPCSVDDGPSCLQQFYGIPASKYNTVLDEINGISPEAARSVLAAHCQTNGYSILAWGKGGVKNQGSYTPVVAGQRVRRSRRHQRSRSSRS
jgi:hypothetical protein